MDIWMWNELRFKAYSPSPQQTHNKKIITDSTNN